MRRIEQSPVTLNVMQQIKDGSVHMRPRAYFTALLIISLVVAALASLVVSYLISILFMWVRIQTADTMAWGARSNLSVALESFPWWAVIGALPLSVAVVWLIRKQGTLYRHSTVTIIVIFTLFVLLLGAGMSTLGIGASHSGGGGTSGPQHNQVRQNMQLVK